LKLWRGMKASLIFPTLYSVLYVSAFQKPVSRSPHSLKKNDGIKYIKKLTQDYSKNRKPSLFGGQICVHSKFDNENDGIERRRHGHKHSRKGKGKRRMFLTSLFSRSKTSKILELEKENESLRASLVALDREKTLLEDTQAQQLIILENFEGENGSDFNTTWWDVPKNSGLILDGDNFQIDNSNEQDIEECDVDDEGNCPTEPSITFKDALRERGYWLVGLLALQSCSGFILARNEALLQAHPVIIYFLTMLVGAGGNAGNQASVRVIRGLALGTLNNKTTRQFLDRELKMAGALCAMMTLAGILRAALFRTPFAETVAIATALAVIVFSSVCLGAVLPLLLKKINIDPAHSSTSIQVVMDILGVLITVAVSTTILDSAFGQSLMSKLMFWS